MMGAGKTPKPTTQTTGWRIFRGDVDEIVPFLLTSFTDETYPEFGQPQPLVARVERSAPSLITTTSPPHALPADSYLKRLKTYCGAQPFFGYSDSATSELISQALQAADTRITARERLVARLNAQSSDSSLSYNGDLKRQQIRRPVYNLDQWTTQLSHPERHHLDRLVADGGENI